MAAQRIKCDVHADGMTIFVGHDKRRSGEIGLGVLGRSALIKILVCQQVHFVLLAHCRGVSVVQPRSQLLSRSGNKHGYLEYSSLGDDILPFFLGRHDVVSAARDDTLQHNRMTSQWTPRCAGKRGKACTDQSSGRRCAEHAVRHAPTCMGSGNRVIMTSEGGSMEAPEAPET